MTCNRCRKHFEWEAEARCPHCGQPASAGVFQTSTVLISMGGKERTYRSVEEVPARLRSRLLKSTNGINSATILIADQRGRQEIARNMRKSPGPAPRRLFYPDLSPLFKVITVGVLLLLTAILLLVLFRFK